MAEKDKTLTTKFDLQTMAEFSVATEILGARSVNALIHQMVKQKIREAKGMVSSEEFAEMVERQKEKTIKRSEMKIKEHQSRIGTLEKQNQITNANQPSMPKIARIMPKSKTSIPVLKINKKETKTG